MDDEWIPKCPKTGIGNKLNCVYTSSGGRIECEEFQNLNCKIVLKNEDKKNDICLYGLFCGRDGLKAAEFAKKNLIGMAYDFQSTVLNSDEISSELENAFQKVDKTFLDTVEPDYLKMLTLQDQMPSDMSEKIKTDRFPHLIVKLGELDKSIKGGSSVLLALIHNEKLFVANVGDCRALLCRVNEHGDLGVTQCSVEHTIKSSQELLRLSKLDLDIEKLQITRGVMKCTRSIGDHQLKRAFSAIDILSSAKAEPVISQPYIHGPEDTKSPNLAFLILMTAAVYEAFEKASPGTEVNQALGALVEKEIKMQVNPNDVAQTVLNKISQMHNDKFKESGNTECLKSDDMTLLVRLFNAELGRGFVNTSHPSTTTNPSRISQLANKVPPLTIPPTTGFTSSSTSPSPASNSGTPTVGHMTNSNTTSPIMSQQPPSSFGTSFRPIHHQMQQPLKPLQPLNIDLTSLTQALDRLPSSPLPDVGDIFRGHHGVNTQQHSNTDSTTSPSQIDSLDRTIDGDSSSSYINMYQPIPPYLKDTSASTNNSSNSGGSNTITNINSERNNSSGSSHHSSSNYHDRLSGLMRKKGMKLDKNGECTPYVDFSDFAAKVDEAGGESVVFAEFLGDS